MVRKEKKKNECLPHHIKAKWMVESNTLVEIIELLHEKSELQKGYDMEALSINSLFINQKKETRLSIEGNLSRICTSVC